MVNASCPQEQQRMLQKKQAVTHEELRPVVQKLVFQKTYSASVFMVGMRPICGSPVPPCAVARARTDLLTMPQHCGLGQKLEPHLLQQ